MVQWTDAYKRFSSREDRLKPVFFLVGVPDRASRRSGESVVKAWTIDKKEERVTKIGWVAVRTKSKYLSRVSFSSAIEGVRSCNEGVVT